MGHKKNSIFKRIAKYKFLYLLGLPGMLIIAIFCYWPMYGILIAFQDYSPYDGVFGSTWVGLQHFKALFADPSFYVMFRNTLTISGLSLLTFPLPIILALLLNEVRRSSYKKFVQTTIYMPHFLSWTVVVSLTFLLLSTEQGLFNKMLAHFGKEPYAFLFDKNLFYPIIIIQKIWKNIGWNSIVYLAAISAVDVSLYEAAVIDGAGKFKQITTVTIPAIMPTVIVMFVLAMGQLVSVDFEHVYQMYNPMNSSLSEIFETFIYRVGIQGTNYSYTTAIGLFKSIINMSLVLLTNWLVQKKGYEGVI